MYSISSNSKILRPPCRSFTGRMVPRRVARLKINHGHYFFISSFFVMLLLMNATLVTTFTLSHYTPILTLVIIRICVLLSHTLPLPCESIMSDKQVMQSRTSILHDFSYAVACSLWGGADSSKLWSGHNWCKQLGEWLQVEYPGVACCQLFYWLAYV